LTEQRTRHILSTLWIFFLLNMVFRDLHEIGTAAFLNGALRGEVNGVVVTEELMLVGFLLIELPLMMIISPLFLRLDWLKWMNIGVALFTGAILALGLPGDLDDRAFAVIEFGSLAVIIWLAWRARHAPESYSTLHSATR